MTNKITRKYRLTEIFTSFYPKLSLNIFQHLISTETIATEPKKIATQNIQNVGKVYRITLSTEALHYFVIKHSTKASE